jgi:hypothetical protein
MTKSDIWNMAENKYPYPNSLLGTKFFVDAQRKAFVEGYLEGQKLVREEEKVDIFRKVQNDLLSRINL